MQVQKEEKIGEVVARNYRAARVFEKFGLDFCCSGKKPIYDACNEKGVDISILLKELSSVPENGSSSEIHFSSLPLDSLIDYIISNHHIYLSKNLPIIYSRCQKVAEKHGENHPEVINIAELFSQLKSELENHLQKEEKMLFPYIKLMVESQKEKKALPYPPFGTVINPVSVMEAEHSNAGRVLTEIRKLSNDFIPPEDACEGYRVLYKELEEFEADLHMHIHLENNILHPKAIELEEILQNNN